MQTSEEQIYNTRLINAKLKNVIVDETTRYFNTQCPKAGSFIGYKKACGTTPGNWTTLYLVKLEIPADAKRSSATNKKRRCSKAKVLSITSLANPAEEIAQASSFWDRNFVYIVGETVEVPDFNEDWRMTCAPRIHFFMNEEDAINYHFGYAINYHFG